MARIRTIKPELFNDDDIIGCCPEAIVAFIGIFCYCDANGIFEAKYTQLKRAILPERDLPKSFERLVLEDLKPFISIYEVAGQPYGVVHTFQKHQKLDRTNDKPKYPTPPDFTLSKEGVWIQNKTSASLTNANGKTSERLGGEGKEGRKEGKGRERKENPTSELGPNRGSESAPATPAPQDFASHPNGVRSGKPKRLKEFLETEGPPLAEGEDDTAERRLAQLKALGRTA